MEVADSHFREDELVEILAGLVRINSENSPATTEEQVARHVHDLLRRNGIAAELDWAAPGRPNVIARLPGVADGPRLLMNGHLDTVPAGRGWTVDPYGAFVRYGRMYGRGTADMKAGVAAMIYAAIVLKRLGLPARGEIVLFFCVDEESVNLGMKKFLQQPVTADYAIVGEPTDLDICVGHKGVTRFRLSTSGKAGHTGFVDEQDNAIYNMTRFIASLEKLGEQIRRRVHPVISNASLTVTQIQGGTAPNIVPDECVIEIDRRSIPDEEEAAIAAELQEYVAAVAAGEGLRYKLEKYTHLPASLIDERHHLVTELRTVAAGILAREIPIKPFRATCEAPFLSKNLGIPTVIFGPGGIQQAHTADEFVELGQVSAAARIYANLALRLLGAD